jgi:peptide chain release factor
MQVSAGDGPEECCCAVGNVSRKIEQEADENGISVSVIHSVPTTCQGNYKSVLLSLSGEGLDHFCDTWQGTVKWIWKSRYRPHHKRKNWFVGIEVFKPVDKENRRHRRELRIETCRSGGPGGQHVNKTETAVRIVHLPTGLSAAASEERSQFMNKKLAMARLETMFRNLEKQRLMDEKKNQWLKHKQLERGNSIRVFKGNDFK